MYGTEEEREKIILDNIGLVNKTINKYCERFKYNLSYDDQYQTGVIGLIKAINGYDENMGTQFSTYAVKCIYREIKEYFEKYGTVIRIPSYVHSKAIKDSTYSDLMERFTPTSLDMPIDENDCSTFHEIIADKSMYCNPESVVFKIDLDNVVNKLTDKQKRVVTTWLWIGGLDNVGSYKKTCEILGCGIGTVNHSIYEFRKILKENGIHAA